MIPIQSISQLMDAIDRVKARAPAYCTNFFLHRLKFENWISHGEMHGDFNGETALIFRRDRDLSHLYFCAASPAALQRRIATWSRPAQDQIVVDLVGNDASLDGLLSLWKSAGFESYQKLFRMARPGFSSPPDLTRKASAGGADGLGSPPPSAATESRVEFAQASDCATILHLLCASFDRRAEQLPMDYEIESAMQNLQILVARRDDALAGLLFFETQGFTSTVKYWLVVDRFRSASVGSMLMNHYLVTQARVRRFNLWVIADNDNAIKRYEHYGFAPDGLLDFVLVNKRTAL